MIVASRVLIWRFSKGRCARGDFDLPSNLADPALGTIGGGNHFVEFQRSEEVVDGERFDTLPVDGTRRLTGSRHKRTLAYSPKADVRRPVAATPLSPYIAPGRLGRRRSAIADL